MPITPDDLQQALGNMTPEERDAILLGTPVPSPPAPEVTAEPPVDDAADDLAELADFYDDELELRHRDRAGIVHVYTLPAADAATGLLCQRMVNTSLGVLTDYNLEQRSIALQEGTEQTLDDSTEEHLYRRLLGGDTDRPGYSERRDVWKQLQDEGAPWPLMRHVGVTALMWAGRDRQTARAYWLDGAKPDPKARTSTPPTPKQPRDRRPKTSEGTASTTPRPASTSSTTPRKKAAAKGTGGRKS